MLDFCLRTTNIFFFFEVAWIQLPLFFDALTYFLSRGGSLVGTTLGLLAD